MLGEFVLFYAEGTLKFPNVFVRKQNEHHFAQKIVLAKKEFLNNRYLI